jgi:hypothetical protein
MNKTDLSIEIALLLFSVIGVIFLFKEMRKKLGDPEISGRFTKSGLRGAYIYYWVGIVCCFFSAIFIVFQLMKNLKT